MLGLTVVHSEVDILPATEGKRGLMGLSQCLLFKKQRHYLYSCAACTVLASCQYISAVRIWPRDCASSGQWLLPCLLR